MKKFQISIFKILYIKCPKCPGTSAFVSQSLGLGRPVPEWDCPVPIPTLAVGGGHFADIIIVRQIFLVPAHLYGFTFLLYYLSFYLPGFER